MGVVFGLNIAKGGVIFTLLWWAWASRRPHARELVICTILGSMLALISTRVIAFLVLLHAALFVTTFEMAELFDGTRRILVVAAGLLGIHR